MKYKGNTLTIGEDTLYGDLMQIERINALAALNPQAVIKMLKDRKIDTNRLERLIPTIQENCFECRKLADAAVELLYHWDPPAAKRLIRQYGI